MIPEQGQVGPAVHRRGHKPWPLALQTVQIRTFPPGSNPENVYLEALRIGDRREPGSNHVVRNRKIMKCC